MVSIALSEPKMVKSKSARKSLTSEVGKLNKKLSLYDALKSRANMVKTDNFVTKSSPLLKSVGSQSSEQAMETESVNSLKVDNFQHEIDNSLESFPVSFHPEEELARMG